MFFEAPGGPTNDQKWVRKRLAAPTLLQERLGGLSGSILEPFWAHVGVQNRSKNASKNTLEF